VAWFLIAVILVATIVAVSVSTAIRAMKLGWIDGVGGAIFGFLAGAIFISAILALIVKYFGEGLVTGSLLAGILVDKFSIVLGLLPSQFDAIRHFFK